MDQGIKTFGDAVLTSLSSALALLFAAIPKILAFLVIVIVGWIIAALLARGVGAILRSVDFDRLAERSGFTAFVKDMGMQTDASGFIALAAKWFIRLIALIVAFDALGLPAVSEVLQSLLLWLPNLIVALVVLVVGGLLADALGGLVRGATSRGGFDNPDMIASIARGAVWSFASIIAVNQLGIASTLVNTLFMAVLGAAALAAGLAFGLGGRDLAAQKLEQWSKKGSRVKPKVAKAAKAAAERATTAGLLGSDDLRKISGIGPSIEAKLNRFGVTRFDQIANWSKKEVERVERELNFKGRVTREKWIPQAQALARQA